MKHRLRLAFLLSALVVSGRAAAQATLVRSNGVLGGPLDYALGASPGAVYVFIPSLLPGPTPLSILDPNDPRTLSVGLDLVSLWSIGLLDGNGAAAVNTSLPNDPGLHGVTLYAQFVTIRLGPIRVDQVSNPTAFRMGLVGASTLTVGEMTRDAQGHTATALDDGTVLVAGGATTVGSSAVSSRELELFDPQTQDFRSLAAMMADDRSAHTATKLADGRVLLLGGSNTAGLVLASAELFDPNSGTVTSAAPMSVPRAAHTATLLADGRVFVAGGTSDLDFSNLLVALAKVHRSTEIYDPSTNSWSAGPNLPRPRALHAATRLGDGRVLITGGIEVTTIIIPIPSFSNDCRAFDPVSGTMQNVSNFNGARALHAQIRLTSGSVLLVGGSDGDLLAQTFTPLASCRLYEPAADLWIDVAPMASPRALGTNVIETGGRIYVIGGLSSLDLATATGTPVTTIESTSTGSIAWSASGAMLTGRPSSVTVPVDGGQRFLTTGSPAVGQPTIDRSAEIYIP